MLNLTETLDWLVRHPALMATNGAPRSLAAITHLKLLGRFVEAPLVRSGRAEGQGK